MQEEDQKLQFLIQAEEHKKQIKPTEHSQLLKSTDEVMQISEIFLKKELTEDEVIEGPSPLRLDKKKTSDKNNYNDSVYLSDEKCNLNCYFGKKLEVEGTFRVTNYSISFLISNYQKNTKPFFEIPLAYVLKSEKLNQEKVGYLLELSLKYHCSIRIRYDSRFELCHKANDIINKLASTSVHYAYDYGSSVPEQQKCLRWQNEQKIDLGEAHLYDNQNWKKFSSYPEAFKVPLPYLSKNNFQDRLVILSFVYPGKQDVAFWRTGPGRIDITEEEWVAKSKNSTKHFIFEIKNKGIGTSKSSAAKAIELQSLSLIRQTFSRFYQLCYTNFDAKGWLDNLNSTKWYEQIGSLLESSVFLAHKIMKSIQVTVLADTDIRSAQVASLVQILIIPECRTLKGFNQLIERQFLQFGHTKSLKKQREEDKGLALIQFFDSVFQLMSIYPLSFEFNQHYLIYLAENVYSNRFGNFLLIIRAIKENERSQVYKCCSIWSEVDQLVKNPEIASIFINSFYVDFKECDIYELSHYLSQKHLKIWQGFFFKKLGGTDHKDIQPALRHEKISKDHYKNKRVVEDLRKQISEMHKQIQQKKKILQELKNLE